MRHGWVYILECSDSTYYTGCTSDLNARLWQHQNGTFYGYTHSRRPVKLLWAEEFDDIRDAIDAERQIKGWSRKKKEALMRGDFEALKRLSKSTKELSSNQSSTSSD